MDRDRRVHGARVGTALPGTAPGATHRLVTGQHDRVRLAEPAGGVACSGQRVIIVDESVYVFNGPFGGGRAATRTDTLLNTEQLIASVTDPRWQLTIDAAP